MLVALTIATLLLAVLLRGLGLGAAGSRRVEAYAEATILAQSVLDTAAVATPLADGAEAERQEGAFRIRAAVHRYRAGPADKEDGYLVPYELTAMVLWRDGAEERSVSLQTLRLGPPR
jgi:hypothetical protein